MAVPRNIQLKHLPSRRGVYGDAYMAKYERRMFVTSLDRCRCIFAMEICRTSVSRKDLDGLHVF
jgi:hypothetical protein